MLEGTLLVLRADAAGVVQPAIMLMTEWPLGLKALLNATSQARTAFDKYVICPKAECGGVWKLDELKGGTLCPRLLSQATESPRAALDPESAHMEIDREEECCGERLFKTDRKQIDKDEVTNVPHQLFPYGGLVPALQSMLLRPGFETQCEQWRALYNAAGKRRAWENVKWDRNGWPECSALKPGPVMSDVVDGQMWEDYMFVDDDQRPYLDEASVTRANQRARHARFRATSSSRDLSPEPEERKDQTASNSKKRKAAAAASSASSSAAASASYAPLPDASPLTASRGPRHELLAQPGVVLALSVNVDWFQRDKSGAYSMGGVYATVLNLPHGLRNLTENIIVLGILPGPKPTSRQALQGAMRLLVDELRDKLFDGVTMKTFAHPEGTKVRAFLFEIVCDTDARVPMGGFLSHSAARGCAYCCQTFSRRVGKGGPDFSWSHTVARVGTESLAPLRTDKDHRASAIEWAQLFPNGKAQHEFAVANGTRYCSLMDLKYFDTVRGAPLDAMHNIFLGLCKALFYVLIDPYSVPQNSEEVAIFRANFKPSPKEAAKETAPAAAAAAAASSANPKGKRHKRRKKDDSDSEEEKEEAPDGDRESEEEDEERDDEDTPGMVVLPPLLIKSDLDRLQAYMHACNVPRDVGQIPGKISRNMSKFKAAEWANWAAIFAVPHLAELMREKAVKLAASKSRRKKFRFESRHLQLYIEMRDVAEAMRSYHCTPYSIRTLERKLLSVVQTTERLFGPNVIKPNMHFCLHLGPMLMDLSSPHNWSCNVYERCNWQLSNLPMNIAFAETCTMRRALQLVSVSHHARTRLNACLEAGPGGVGPSTKDYEMIQRILCGEETLVVSNHDAVQVRSRVTASGGRQMTYQWMQPDGFAKFQLALDPVGTEPYPGLLREKGKFAATLDMDGMFVVNDKLWTELVSKEHLVNCLMKHYVMAHATELTQATTDDPDRREKMDNCLLKKSTASAEFFRHARKSGHVLPFFTVYRALDLGGQVFGSRLASHKNSFVRVEWFFGGRWRPCYAQVNFYFTHDFAVPSTNTATVPHTTTWENKTHHFASVRWFTPPAASAHKLDPAVVSLLQDSNPYLSLVPDLAQVTDIVCIQRLAGRWIACKRAKAGGAGGSNNMMQVLNIPFSSRIHA